MSKDFGRSLIHRAVTAADRWQRKNRVVGPGYGVIKKFSDDRANLLVVSLGWYGLQRSGRG